MIKVQTVNSITVQDWDDLVKKTYGRTYSLQQQDGCKERGLEHISVPCEAYDFEDEEIPEEINGDIMGVSFSAWLARDPKEWNGEPENSRFLKFFWLRNFYPSVDVIANDLYAKGLLPAGDYQIVIDW